VILFGGSNQLGGALDTLEGLANQVMPIPSLKQMAAPALQGEYRLKTIAGFDVNKPLRFALFNPKKYKKNPLVLCVGAKSKDAFLKSMPETGRKEGDEGNQYSYLKRAEGKRPVYINFMGDLVCISRMKGIFPEHKEFLKSLKDTPMPNAGALFVEVAHLMKIFGQEFDMGIKQAKQMMTMAAGAVPGGVQGTEMVTQMIDLFGKGAQDTQSLSFSLLLEKDGAKLDMRVKALEGSELSKVMAKMLKKGKMNLLSKLPADSAGFGIFSMAEEGALLLADFSGKFLSPMFDKPELAAPYIEAMRDYVKGIDGEVAFSVSPKGEDFGFMGLFGVKDVKLARAAQVKLMEMHNNSGIIAYYQKLGFKIDYQPKAYEVDEVPVAVVKTEMLNPSPQMMGMVGMMSEFMTQHFAIGEKLAVIGYGKAGRGVVEALLKGKAKGGLDKVPGVLRARKNQAHDAFALFYLNPIDLARRISLGGMNPLIPILKDVKASHGIAFSAGSVDKELQFIIDVPIETIKQGKLAFDKAKGGL